MICCKIIADYNNPSASFSKLLETLGKNGEFKWQDGSLFFADVNGKTNEKSLIKAVKKAGYKKCFIDEYTDDNPVKETDDEINAWLLNKISQMAYYKFENASQSLFKEISHGLDILEEELDKLTNKEKNT